MDANVSVSSRERATSRERVTLVVIHVADTSDTLEIYGQMNDMWVESTCRASGTAAACMMENVRHTSSSCMEAFSHGDAGLVVDIRMGGVRRDDVRA